MERERQKIVNHCQPCETSVQFAPLYVHEWVGDDGSDVEYVFAVCSVCGEPALFYKQDKAPAAENEADSSEFLLVYPNPRQDNALSSHVPTQITELYYEAAGAKKAGLRLAAAVMVVRTVEAVCKQFFPQCWSNLDGLEQMHKAGIISKQMLEWGYDLRVLRDATTRSEKYSEWDIDVSLDFIQTLLTYLYDVAHRFDAYKKASAGREAGKGAPKQADNKTPAAAEP